MTTAPQARVRSVSPVVVHITATPQKTKVFLHTSCAYSIPVEFSKFQTVNSGCPSSQSLTFSARLLLDETFAQSKGVRKGGLWGCG